MTKKDYKAIAEILRNNTFSEGVGTLYFYQDAPDGGSSDAMGLVSELCEYFKQDNPRFDKEKFMEAVCGE